MATMDTLVQDLQQCSAPPQYEHDRYFSAIPSATVLQYGHDRYPIAIPSTTVPHYGHNRYSSTIPTTTVPQYYSWFAWCLNGCFLKWFYIYLCLIELDQYNLNEFPNTFYFLVTDQPTQPMSNISIICKWWIFIILF